MAKCIDCNKKGLFLRVNKNGLCAECELKRCEQERLKAEAEELERKKRRKAFLKRQRETALEELNNVPNYTIVVSNEKRNRQTGYEDVKTSNITPKGKYNEFVVLDTETTGLTPSRDRIIELAAIRFVDGMPVEKFETLINPEKEIPQEVTKINHIDNDMVKDFPRISEVLPSFEEFVGNCPVIAHNLEFDLKFLYYSGCSFFEEKRKFYDTLEQAQKLLRKANSRHEAEEEYDVENYKLATLCEYFNITIPCKHRAAADAIATGKLFLALVEEKQSR